MNCELVELVKKKGKLVKRAGGSYDKDDAWRTTCRLLEQRADPARAATNEHFHKV